MARRSTNAAIGGEELRERQVRGARLEPIRVVERELTRPDGTTCRVKVPVYPPFRLEEPKARAPRAGSEEAEKKSA